MFPNGLDAALSIREDKYPETNRLFHEPVSREKTTPRAAPPASNTYVRYLLDAQLFNVPANHKKFKFLLTYLHHERIFDVTFVASLQNNKLKRSNLTKWWTPVEQRENMRWNKRRQHGASENEHENQCNSIFDKYCGGSGPAGGLVADMSNGTYDRELHEVQEQTMFATSSHNGGSFSTAKMVPPINAYDVRDLLQNVKLTGGQDEWLDLKIQLCLPSVLFFVKLKGSPTKIPNADYTVLVDMKQMHVLSGEESLGEKLAKILAILRKRYMGVEIPNFESLQILAETEDIDYDDDDDDDVARYQPKNSTLAIEADENSVSKPEAKAPRISDEYFSIGAEETEAEERRRQKKLRDNSFGTGTIRAVYAIQNDR